MSGGTGLDLTHGAVAAMSGPQAAEGLRPVLQLADAPRPEGNHTERYGVLLSDGVHSQEAVLDASMNGLVRAGLLRRGSVVRVLDYVCSYSVENRRIIIVIQLEVLQTDCTLIGDFDGPGNIESTKNVCRTIAQIKDENFGMSRQHDLIIVVAAISYVHTDAFCYPACTLMFNGKRCNRKVTTNGDGWWCKRCLRSSENCEYRYLLTCQICDHSGSTYATAFHEAAEEIIGHKAQEFFTIKDVQQDDAKFKGIVHGILWDKYRFKLRVKERAGHGVKKFGIVKADKLNPSDMSRHVLGEILGETDGLLKGESSSAPGAQGTVTSSPQARLTAQTTYGGGMTIASTSCAHSVPMLGQTPTPPQAIPSVRQSVSNALEVLTPR
ncbi:unnamed protein product [Alopecurus aequalis]